MLVQMSRDDILARNPQLPVEELAKMEQLHQQLREMGMEQKRYDLDLPFEGPRIMVNDSANDDARLIRLSRVHHTAVHQTAHPLGTVGPVSRL